MAVLIKGMEMPKSCERCFIKPGYCPAIIKRMKSDVPGYTWIPANYRHEDCPLIEVPEPHGRLIDADALDIYQRADAAHAEYQEDEDNFYLEGIADGLCEAAKQLSVARTIIPANEEG